MELYYILNGEFAQIFEQALSRTYSLELLGIFEQGFVNSFVSQLLDTVEIVGHHKSLDYHQKLSYHF